MEKIEATIDSKIHLDRKQLSSNILEKILSHLTIVNPAKKLALREHLWEAENLPDYIFLWEYNNNDELILPRGFVFAFEKILKDNDIEIDWDYSGLIHRENYRSNHLEIGLRSYQKTAKEKLIHYANGVYRAPTGSGKTRTMLSIIRDCQQKTIVFVEKKDLVSQWVIAANEIGIKAVSVIGDGYWNDEFQLVIALRQSVWNHVDELDDDWYKRFGMVVYDEAHHAGADSSFDLIQRFPAYYRFGCSATPDSDPARWDLVKAVIGPIIADTSLSDAKEALVIPSIKVVDTKFDFDYHPTKKVFGRIVRNNYNSMMKYLEKDVDRNELIVNYALSEAIENKNHCIILSKRKNHLDEMINMIPEEVVGHFLLHILTGDNSDRTQEIKDSIENGYQGSILFSTLIEEGTDIPCLNRLFLTYPGRKVRGFEQAIGRIMRTSPKKKDAIVYDFRDVDTSLLRGQFRERMHKIYNAKGYNVEFLNR
jgi:superfamily II DNA or RNA helicase